ncbi:AT-hook motif nuclear-localized protein 17 [Sesamum alatum]|uniref:AT-hook motif nuclear-localized protein n=1 Tax=Sesamum alatum TaxID=300844 RepID=A0AAE1YEY5_9LAMI|nr:AT-hook motif nuclear-localized protein 17 [Sesamum alatum]
MKRGYVEEKPHLSNTTNMFSELHQTHNSKFRHPSQPQYHQPTAAHCLPTSQEANSDHHSLNRRSNDVKDQEAHPFPLPPPAHNGATIELVRRRRGRPPASKNKPKPPVIITRDSPQPTMDPYVLALPAGVDVVESTTQFCRKRNTGLCVLNGNGVVANVTLKQHSTNPGTTVAFHGRFDILSISATILPAAGGLASANGQFSVSVAGPQGQVVGGVVVGPLLSAGTVYLIAATFNNPSFQRLQQMDYDQDTAAGDDGYSSRKASSGGSDSAVAPESGGISMYSYQPLDVILAPNARQLQPPPPPPY